MKLTRSKELQLEKEIAKAYVLLDDLADRLPTVDVDAEIAILKQRIQDYETIILTREWYE